MQPTNHLRFIERVEVVAWDPQGDTTAGRRRVRVLQQWFAKTEFDIHVPSNPGGTPGEWRDVPLEQE